MLRFVLRSNGRGSTYHRTRGNEGITRKKANKETECIKKDTRKLERK
jgi:hypothetical protein